MACDEGKPDERSGCLIEQTATDARWMLLYFLYHTLQLLRGRASLCFFRLTALLLSRRCRFFPTFISTFLFVSHDA